MKTLGLLICLLFSFNILASTKDAGDLEKIFDEYVYSITVEWDQKDKDFFNKTNDDLYKEIEILVKNKKMKVEDVFTFAKSKSVNPLLLIALNTLLQNHDKQKFDTTKVIEFLQENSKALYSKGTSWNGTINVVGGIVIISTIIGILVAYDGNDVEKECIEYFPNPNCDWTQGSSAWQCNSGCARWE